MPKTGQLVLKVTDDTTVSSCVAAQKLGVCFLESSVKALHQLHRSVSTKLTSVSHVQDAQRDHPEPLRVSEPAPPVSDGEREAPGCSLPADAVWAGDTRDADDRGRPDGQPEEGRIEPSERIPSAASPAGYRRRRRQEEEEKGKTIGSSQRNCNARASHHALLPGCTGYGWH